MVGGGGWYVVGGGGWYVVGKHHYSNRVSIVDLIFKHRDISGLIDFLPGLYSVQSYINCYMLSRNKKLLGKQILKFLLQIKEEKRLSVNNN